MDKNSKALFITIGVTVFAVVAIAMYLILRPTGEEEIAYTPGMDIEQTEEASPTPEPSEPEFTDGDSVHDEDDVEIPDRKSTFEPELLENEVPNDHDDIDAPTADEFMVAFIDAITAEGSYDSWEKKLKKYLSPDMQENLSEGFRDYYMGGEVVKKKNTAPGDTWNQQVVLLDSTSRAFLITAEVTGADNGFGWVVTGISTYDADFNGQD